MPIIQCGNYLLEVKAEEREAISNKLNEEGWILLNDFSVEDFCEGMRTKGYSIELYRMIQTLERVPTEAEQTEQWEQEEIEATRSEL